MEGQQQQKPLPKLQVIRPDTLNMHQNKTAVGTGDGETE